MQAAVATEIQKVTLEETRRITSGSTFFHGITVQNASDLNYEVVFTDNDGLEILSIAVPTRKTIRYKVSFFADNGLIITGLNDSGVAVTLAYTDDTVPVAAQAYTDGLALSFDGNEWLKNKAAGDLLSIDNAWSIQCIHNNDLSNQNSYLVSIQNDDSNKGSIRWLANGNSSPETVRCTARNTVGGTIKDYLWDIDVVVGTSVNYMVTWDGTDLLFYADGLDQVANVTKSTDNAGTMEDAVREIAFANQGTSDFADLSANMHSVAMWDVALSAAAILALENGGSHADVDARFAIGNYTSEDNLMHYWRLGLDRSDLGRDWGNAAALVNVNEDSTATTAADIVTYS